MKVYDCEQGSDAWLQLRVGKITASRYKDARDFNSPTAAEKKEGATRGKPSAKCTAYAAQVAVERIAQRAIDKTFQSWQMREGQEQEPYARAAYDVETGAIVQEVGAFATDDDLFLYSPDGLIGDDGLLEIKTLLSPDVILRVIGEGDLSAYMDQCMGGLWLTGRQWIDLVLWAPALEPIGRQLTIHRITRDEDAIEALETDLMAFAGMVRDAERKLRAGATPPPADKAPEPNAAAAPAPTPAPAVSTVEAFTAPANVHPMPTRAPAAPAGPPTLKLGEINARIGLGKWSEEDLRRVGFPAAARVQNACMYHEADFKPILAAIAQHMVAVQMQRAA